LIFSSVLILTYVVAVVLMDTITESMRRILNGTWPTVFWVTWHLKPNSPHSASLFFSLKTDWRPELVEVCAVYVGLSRTKMP